MSYMPDTRTHRGPHPGDAQLFTAQTLPVLRRAVSEMSWLLSRGYGDKSSQKLVGDRYTLTQRQRLAVMRACCSDSQLENRAQKQMLPDEIESGQLLIDGYNLLITVEAALAGAPLFIGRDGCIRDLASVHGTYRKVQETLPAIEVIAHILTDLKMSEVSWYLDEPVSNSGRLKQIILSYFERNGLNWNVKLVPNPDTVLITSSGVIVSSDSNILDNCQTWLNLARIIIENPQFPIPLKPFDLGDQN
ncbi:MAG: DUF434 domain-containing protein [Anaerohalosphaeraceae bacterium]